MGKFFKTTLLLFVLIAIIQLFSLPVGASTLNVPSDFPGNFRMDLLAWNVFVDQPADNYSWPDATVNPVEGYIDFNATSFDGDGDPTWGTSTLSSTADYVELATSVYYGLIWQFFINGTGTGLITDNGDGTGDWELTIPTLSLVEGIADVPLIISMEDLTLSTNSTVTYYGYNGNGEDPDYSAPLMSASGVPMDYATGDCVLVGQVMTTEPGFFEGSRVTFVINANDPVIAAIPEPSSIFLVATGLLGLVRSRRKSKRSLP